MRRWKTTFDQHSANGRLLEPLDGASRALAHIAAGGERRGVRRVVARLRGHRKVFRVVGESGAVGRLQRQPDPTKGAQQACWSGFSELFHSDPSADWSQGAIKSGNFGGKCGHPDSGYLGRARTRPSLGGSRCPAANCPTTPTSSATATTWRHGLRRGTPLPGPRSSWRMSLGSGWKGRIGGAGGRCKRSGRAGRATRRY